MKKGGSSKTKKQQAAIAIAMKAAGKKPKMQKGGTPFQQYVNKYPGSGSDTLAINEPRGRWVNSGFAGEGIQKTKDLRNAFTKTYGDNDMTGVDQEDEAKYRVKQRKIGGSVSKMKKGGSVGTSKKSKFGMLSVKAGMDKNPKATAADRIAGAKMKKGSPVKKTSKKK